jgi:hypothetical protein
MLTLDRRVARLSHAWMAVPCRTCNAEIGADCNPAAFGPGPHPERISYARVLGFRESDQAELGFLREHPPVRRAGAGLPEKPEIDPAVMVSGPRPLVGDIRLGEVFAWEPGLPHARELCIVSRIVTEPGRETIIWTYDMDYRREVWNDESRFREAAVRTQHVPLPARPLAIPPLPEPSALHDRWARGGVR